MENQVLTYILIGSLLIAVLILFIIILDINNGKRIIKREQEIELERKQLIINQSAEVMKTIEEERMRMAFSFHDTVVPVIVNLKHSLHFLINSQKSDKFDEKLERRVKDLINEILDHQRSIIHNLAPKSLYVSGIKDAFYEYLSGIIKFQVNFTSEDDDSLSIESQANFNVYSILMELVNNIVKYENIEELNVHLSISNGIIQIIIQHNGIGLSNEEFLQLAQERKGYGITSIKRRLEFLNGKIDLLKQEVGAIIMLTIPPQNG
jgi:two-component system NarL family sensor kinase